MESVADSPSQEQEKEQEKEFIEHFIDSIVINPIGKKISAIRCEIHCNGTTVKGSGNHIFGNSNTIDGTFNAVEGRVNKSPGIGNKGKCRTLDGKFGSRTYYKVTHELSIAPILTHQ